MTFTAESTPDAAGPKRETRRCEEAFAALRLYDAGSSRAALLPIDEAVRASLRDAKARRLLQIQLLEALRTGGSAVAKEYICSKLVLVGTRSAVPALAALLQDPQLSTAARNALEAIPGAAASKALRKQLPVANDVLKIGVINSLAARRDQAAVGALAGCLRSGDREVVVAAAGALGKIGTARAGRALLSYFSSIPASLRRECADALLVCAERLKEQGRTSDAATLLKLLLSETQPPHIRRAAEHALRP